MGKEMPTLLEFHQSVKLGKKAARIDARTLKLAKYIAALPAAPPESDNTAGITSWGMMLNDRLGCCTIAGIGHSEQAWSAARGGEYTVPDSVILSKYEQWCGYVNGDPSTDNGADEISVLNQWRKNEFYGHPLKMYADPDPQNLSHVKQAIHYLGGVYIGVQLPLSAQGQQVWDYVGGANGQPGSWGGHCVFVPKYRTLEDGSIMFTAISWGGLYDITQAFWMHSDPSNGPYIDEVHGLVAPEFISLKTGKTPEGLDLVTMEADAQAAAA